MKAKDTVMDSIKLSETIQYFPDWDLNRSNKFIEELCGYIAKAQAEISFKAGQEAEREIIRYVALNYPTKTAIQIIDNLDGLRPRGGQCADNTSYMYDGPKYTR